MFNYHRVACPAVMVVFLVSMLCGDVQGSVAQAAAGQSLQELIDQLPLVAASGPEQFGKWSEAISAKPAAEWRTALPRLVHWVDDDRPAVRFFALIALASLPLPNDAGPNGTQQRQPVSLTLENVDTIARHVHDPDASVRGPALLALQPTLRSLLFRERVVVDLLPILREPDALTKYPDHRGDAANAAMMARTPPRVAAQINRARKQSVFPPIGPELLRLLAPSAAQQDAVDEAILAFLARPDQTPQTLREVVRSISLNPQDERLNQAVEQVALQPPALSAETISYLPRFEVEPAFFERQKIRLKQIAEDRSQPEELRQTARQIGMCWDNDRHHACTAGADVYGSPSSPDRSPEGRAVTPRTP